MTNHDKQLYSIQRSEFLNACLDGHLEIVQCILSPDNPLAVDLSSSFNDGLRNAVRCGQLSITQYLINSPDIKKYLDVDFDCLYNACKYGDVATFERLIHLALFHNNESSYQFNIHEEHATTHQTLLMVACANGHVDIVKYLLTDKTLTEHAQINQVSQGGQNAFLLAAGNLEIIQFLLDSNDLTEHANLYQKDNDKAGILNYCCEFGYYDTIHYLLIDKNMMIDEQTSTWLHDNAQHEIIQMIQTRDHFHELDKKLEEKNLINTVDNKRLKI